MAKNLSHVRSSVTEVLNLISQSVNKDYSNLTQSKKNSKYTTSKEILERVKCTSKSLR